MQLAEEKTKRRLQTFNIILFGLVCFSDSMDTVLNLNVAGFSLRLVLVFFVCSIFLFLFRVAFVNRGKIFAVVHGGVFLVLWLCVLALFSVNSPLLSRNLFYFLWLLLSVAYVVSLSEWVRTETVFRIVFRVYLTSVVAMAVLGIAQFVLGLFGIYVFVTQTWMQHLVRVSAFSYEPAYYATYLIGAWVALLVLFVFKEKHSFKFPVFFSLVLVTVALVLSGSRAGWLIMAVVATLLVLIEIVRSIKRRKFSVFGLGFVGGYFACIIAVVFTFLFSGDRFVFLLNGLGFANQASHSIATRVGHQEDMLDAFIQNPFIGTGLGGIPASVAGVQGKLIFTQTEAKPYEGINVFLEVLLGSGLFGFFFFVGFLLLFSIKAIDYFLKARETDPESAYIRLALFGGFVITLVILATNQNILRPYVWVLMAVLNAGLSLPAIQKKKETTN